ncbi:MAG: YihY/virulence factor BrkB family protein [Gemmatimonadetes bacterium]|nr:YihY/virulence factor BrkB family protein [Gemmatimonadota bacterium]
MPTRITGRIAARIAGAARGAVLRVLHGSFDFVVRVYNKAGQDDIFFLAGGIAFNVLVAAIPFLLMLIAFFGFVMQATLENPQQVAVEYVVSFLPASEAIVTFTRTMVDDIIGGSAPAGVFGLLLFVWFSTRLIGSLRSVLREVFDLQEDRGIVQGKIFDAIMVVVLGTLFLANTGITVAIEAVHTYGVRWLGVQDYSEVRMLQAFYGQLLAFGFIFLMFVLAYRYLPARRIPWRVALVAGMFTAVVWEILKAGFAWYIAYIANYGTTYGYLATVIILVFWIYYSSIVFILGGEVGQVYGLTRIRHKQRELLES